MRGQYLETIHGRGRQQLSSALPCISSTDEVERLVVVRLDLLLDPAVEVAPIAVVLPMAFQSPGCAIAGVP